jgi:hypothetical protein
MRDGYKTVLNTEEVARASGCEDRGFSHPSIPSASHIEKEPQTATAAVGATCRVIDVNAERAWDNRKHRIWFWVSVRRMPGGVGLAEGAVFFSNGFERWIELHERVVNGSI